MKKTLFLIIFFYFLCLFQTSFLVHFSILGFLPNLILLFVILVNILENKKEYSGITASAFAGFFMDVFSENPIGIRVLVFLGLSLLIKFFFKKHFYLSAKIGKK